MTLECRNSRFFQDNKVIVCYNLENVYSKTPKQNAILNAVINPAREIFPLLDFMLQTHLGYIVSVQFRAHGFVQKF